jgi:hypothetical protein
MSSVSSASQGVSDLFQALSNTGSSSVTSVLSSSSLQSKLEGASSDDVVKLSEQALQLQQANGLFGASAALQSAAAGPAATPDSLLLQAISSSITGSPTAPANPNPGTLSLVG